MNQNILIGLGLVLGISLLVGIFLFPVDNVLLHNTRAGVNDSDPAHLGNPVIAYQNLSDRGKELYRKTLTAGGEYTVPKGEGAPEFVYPTKREARIRWSDGGPLNHMPVIKRPANDSGLPPADESAMMGTRYDAITTHSVKPPLTAAPWILRYLAGLVGVVLLAGSGYALYRKRSAG